MLRKLLVLGVLIGAAGLLPAQSKDKDTRKDKADKMMPKKGQPVRVTRVDVKKMMFAGHPLKEGKAGKAVDYQCSKDTKFFGPNGGKATIRDDRLQPGSVVGVVMEDRKVTE